MQEPRSSSTLELVVNEQQLQNMSQIDLSGSRENNHNDQSRAQLQNQSNERFSFQRLKSWPARFRANFNTKMDEAKAKSDTKTEFVMEILQAFSGIVIWFICFVCTIIVPVILFFIGLLNLDNCPDRTQLPYLVFATGFAMSASNIFNLALALNLPILTNHQILSSDVKNIIASIVNMIFNCVVAFLYILMAYMVFTTGKRSQSIISADNANSDDGGDSQIEPQPLDCSAPLYHFTFWFVTSTLSLLALLTLVAAIFFAYNRHRLAIIRGSMPRSQETANAANISSTNRV